MNIKKSKPIDYAEQANILKDKIFAFKTANRHSKDLYYSIMLSALENELALALLKLHGIL